MHLTDGTTVDTALDVTVVLAIYDSAGSSVPGILVVTLYVLEALPSSCVLGCPFSLPVTLLLTGLGALLLLVL